jgi:SAM-dependent methyltransferase
VSFRSGTFGPASIDRVDLSMLAEITGLSTKACLERLASWSPDELAQEWRLMSPSQPAEILEFYANTEGYVWELFAWHGSAAYNAHRRRIDTLASRWPSTTHARALDYGAGIGTAALELAARGHRVTLAEVRGRTFEVAQARFAGRGLAVDLISVTTDAPALPAESWDVAICFDVLEHVPDPAATARGLVRSVRPDGGLAIVTAFELQGAMYPQHLPEHAARFGAGRWASLLKDFGAQELGDCVYRRTTFPA